MSLTFGSLFSGIGGLDLGLERAGMKCLWQVECDPYAQKVLRKHWPHVELYNDVRTVNATMAGRVDLICGGFPCQDISVAGKGAGLAGERSGLWREFHRVICEFRPRFVLVENVSALLARGLGVVLGDLASGGYDAEWDCVPAAAVGAPHRRDRLFVVAYAQRDHLRQQPEPKRGRRRAAVAGVHGAQGALAHPDRLRELQPEGRQRDNRRRLGDGSGWWTSEPDVGRVAHGIPSRVDRLRTLGNAVVPQVAEFIGRRILAHAELP